MAKAMIYHICREDEWSDAVKQGIYTGSSQDKSDGFIHFSTGEQIRGSAAKHRSGQDGLVLLTVDAEMLGAALKWEPSRDGALFPHLYGPLPLDAVIRTDPLPLNAKGRHEFPNSF